MQRRTDVDRKPHDKLLPKDLEVKQEGVRVLINIFHAQGTPKTKKKWGENNYVDRTFQDQPHPLNH